MIRRIILFSAIWLVVLLLCSFRPQFEARPLIAPLALDKTPEEIKNDLREFVPGKLNAYSVPGVSIAVVRGGEVIYSESFGMTDTFTRTPVTPDTVFEVASISKPMTAYAALQLVERGKIRLQAPMAGYLEKPYVDDPAGDSITLHQVLTHTSGLTNQLDKKPKIVRTPGESFSYSGQGFLYAGKVIEAVTGQPLDTYLETEILPKLEMKQAGYSKEGLSAQMASPHTTAILPLWAFMVPAFGAYLVLCLLAWLAARFIAHQELSRRWKIGILYLSIVIGLMMPFVLRSTSTGIRFVVVNTAFLLLCWIIWTSYTKIRSRRKEGSDSSWQLRDWIHLSMLLLSVNSLVYVLIRRPAIPLQQRAPNFTAAAGLRATAPDMAKFLVELMEPRHISKELMDEMQSAQVDVNDRNAWGLAIGIQNGDQSTAIWHWGINYPGFQALMIGYPKEKIGIVILTNGGPISITRGELRYAGLEMAREIAYRAIGGEHYGYWHGVQ